MLQDSSFIGSSGKRLSAGDRARQRWRSTPRLPRCGDADPVCQRWSGPMRAGFCNLAALSLAVGGCATLGSNVSGDFACRAPNGSCAPTSAIDDAATLKKVLKDEILSLLFHFLILYLSISGSSRSDSSKVLNYQSLKSS